jgi:hypothetical protein
MKHTTIQEYIMTGGPPAEMPTIKTPAKALQLFEKTSISFGDGQMQEGWPYLVTILKANPIMPSRLKERWSSVSVSIMLLLRDIIAFARTLLIAQIRQLRILGHSLIYHVTTTL